MGCFLANQLIQDRIEAELSKSKMNFLSALILLALYFENSEERLGPSRLANTLGFSRSRISQEVTSLQKKGLLSRKMADHSARETSLKLTSAGDRRTQEIIKSFSVIQSQIDKKIGEKTAEEINSHLLKLIS
jgi:DNA-binding MarR family transcriptional regulator